MRRPGLMLCALAAAPAMGQSRLWVTQFDVFPLWDFAAAVQPTGSGGAYVAGKVGMLPCVLRYSDGGVELWRHHPSWTIPGNCYGAATGLALDGTGGFFLVGGIDCGIGDVGLARCAGDGTEVWALRLTSSPSTRLDEATGVVLDGAGGFFVAGQTRGAFAGSNAGNRDVWFARYSGAGSQLWIRQIGTAGEDFAGGIAADGAGGFFVAGSTEGVLGAGSEGGTDAWIARYDGNGNQAWIRQFGTAEGDYAARLAPDGAGGVVCAGGTAGTMAEPNPAPPAADAWIARYSAGGDRLWIHQFGTTADDAVSAMSPDGAGGILVGGGTSGSLGGSNAGASDAWFARFGIDGTMSWARQLGSLEYEYTLALSPDGAGGLYAGGPTAGNLGGPYGGGTEDGWLARYGACYSNCDGSTAPPVLNVLDFNCFINAYTALEAYANCDGSTNAPTLNILDFNCFVNRYTAGCP